MPESQVVFLQQQRFYFVFSSSICSHSVGRCTFVFQNSDRGDLYSLAAAEEGGGSHHARSAHKKGGGWGGRMRQMVMMMETLLTRRSRTQSLCVFDGVNRWHFRPWHSKSCLTGKEKKRKQCLLWISICFLQKTFNTHNIITNSSEAARIINPHFKKIRATFSLNWYVEAKGGDTRIWQQAYMVLLTRLRS